MARTSSCLTFRGIHHGGKTPRNPGSGYNRRPEALFADPMEGELPVSSDPTTPRRVDSHFHFWDPAQRDYPWMPDALKRRYGPDDLRPLLAANGFESAVLVQTVSDVDETREFLN